MLMNHILRSGARCMIPRGHLGIAAARFAHHGKSTEPYDEYAHMKGDTRVTLDEATHPEGPWQENYDKLQRKYNTHLALGIATFTLTVLAVWKGELLFFNYFPPTLDEE